MTTASATPPITRSGRVPPVVGRLCLDFAHTGGRGEYAALEALREPRDLSRWLAISPLAAEGVPADEADLEAARDLRDAVHRSARAVLAGGEPASADVAALNAAAAEPPLVPHLDAPSAPAAARAAPGPDGDGGAAGRRRPVLRWREPRVAAALSDIARDTLRLVADPAQRARIRECAAPDCPVMFYDGSRPGRRRWCEADRCGDRNRARAHRARAASRTESPDQVTGLHPGKATP